jgi:hypothetical protein
MYTVTLIVEIEYLYMHLVKQRHWYTAKYLKDSKYHSLHGLRFVGMCAEMCIINIQARNLPN